MSWDCGGVRSDHNLPSTAWSLLPRRSEECVEKDEQQEVMASEGAAKRFHEVFWRYWLGEKRSMP